MHIRFWRLPLKGRAAAKQLVTSAAVLALVVGTLTTSMLFARPAAVQAHPATAEQQHTTTVHTLAQDGTTPRLEVFEASSGYIWHKWSDDHGATWHDWVNLDTPPPYSFFIHTPAVVSDGTGRLTVIARDQNTPGTLWEDDYSNGQWSGWTLFAAYVFVGGDPNNAANYYNFISDPALTSWASGRRDLFAYVVNEATGVMRLFHRWGDTYAWTNGELLGTSIDLQGSPAAVSWGYGRIDIFGRDAVNHLAHKWYDGSWHNWEDLGGTLASNPTVSSGGAGYLNIFARNTTNGLSQISFWTSVWGPWWDLDSNTISSAPAAAETPGYIHLFALNLDGNLSSKFWTNQWWSGWSALNPATATLAAVVWAPVAPPPQDPPQNCGGAHQPPCP